MTPRTTTEIIQAINARMDGSVFSGGVSPLADPDANKANTLVKMTTALASGIADVEQRVYAVKYENSPDKLAEELLDALGARRGILRGQNTTTKWLANITGDDCAVLPVGSVLVDLSGREWLTVEDVQLSANGSLLAGGTVTVESSSPGCYYVERGEMRLKDEVTGVNAATNVYLIEKGGEYESDAAYRARLKTAGALVNVDGTLDYTANQIRALSGVNFVRYHPCDDGLMWVVHGGGQAEICDIISKSSAPSLLLGDIECTSSCFNSARFQRPCPVMIDIELTLNCDCPVITEAQAEQFIRAKASDLAYLTRFNSSYFSKLHPDILNVKFKIKPFPYSSCGDTDIVDPITGGVPDLIQVSTCTFCRAVACEVSDWQHLVTLKPYEMPIIDAVTFTACDSGGACG